LQSLNFQKKQHNGYSFFDKVLYRLATKYNMISYLIHVFRGHQYKEEVHLTSI